MAQFLRLHLVQVFERVEAAAAHAAIHAFGIADIKDWVAAGSALHALEDRGQEAAAPGAFTGTGKRATGDEHDKAGQVLVFGAKAVGGPRAHRQPALPRRPSVYA